MISFQGRWMRVVLLVLLMGALAIVQENFVGDVTIYSLRFAKEREASHEHIIQNHAPTGGWQAHGENGNNVRIAIPYFVEFLHKTTNIRILQLYKLVDLVLLWLGFVLFYFFLRRWFLPVEALFACVYFVAILPLTFAFHSYQPWDRASFVAWLLGLWTARDGRFWAFFAIAIAATFIKYDAVVLPGLYLLANADRQNWRKIFVQSFAVGVTLLAIFATLRVLIPGGFEPRDYGGYVLRNLGHFVHDPVAYAPSLAFALPLVLAVLGYRFTDRFMRASLWMAGLIAIVLFVSTNFEEVRAEQMLFLLLAPAAMVGLRKVANDPLISEAPPASR